MDTATFVSALEQSGISFFTGVPDSLLSGVCDEIYRRFGVGNPHHIVAHNEGGSVGLAAGYHLATGKVGCVYMQNSGIGNAANPITSLTHPLVYAIPMLFIVGWRGEPGTKDEPQHVYQGEITVKLLEDLGIAYQIMSDETTLPDVEEALGRFAQLFAQGKSAAFLVRKGAFSAQSHPYHNDYTLPRERAIEILAEAAGRDLVVSTTGKISRELFEIRERRGEGHEQDFLTVGSMGHAIMVGLGIALAEPRRRVWCLDGDGAALMHMGALGLVGHQGPPNLIHVVLNNAAHDTVGGLPTVARSLDFADIAEACGYASAQYADTESRLFAGLERAMSHPGPHLLDVSVELGSRADLGRPTTTPQENKDAFMAFVRTGGLA